ncbi:hypothetical protein ACFX2C_028099 [Malus domestica]
MISSLFHGCPHNLPQPQNQERQRRCRNNDEVDEMQEREEAESHSKRAGATLLAPTSTWPYPCSSRLLSTRLASSPSLTAGDAELDSQPQTMTNRKKTKPSKDAINF